MNQHSPQSASREAAVSEDAKRRGHEVATIPLMPVVLATALFFGVLAASMFAMRGLFRGLEENERQTSPPPMAKMRQVPPAPRLQVDARGEIEAHEANMEAALTEPGWIDEAHGVVRIPVERAMELVAERGLPHREPSGGEK